MPVGKNKQYVKNEILPVGHEKNRNKRAQRLTLIVTKSVDNIYNLFYKNNGQRWKNARGGLNSGPKNKYPGQEPIPPLP